MLRVPALLVLASLMSGCGPMPSDPWEVSSQLPMTITALHHHADGSVTVFRDANASFRCIEYDTTSGDYGLTRWCLHYALLSNRGLVIDFLDSNDLLDASLESTAHEVALRYRGVTGSGRVVATRADKVDSDPGYGGDYYVDLAGEFVATFGDETFENGVFYANGEP